MLKDKAINMALGGTILLVSVPVVLCVAFISFLWVSDWLSPQSNGSQYLGKNIYLLDWDGGKIVVIGTNMHGNTCYGGTLVIPDSTEYKYDETTHRLTEQIIDATSTTDWIAVTTFHESDNKHHYYLIDKSALSDNNTCLDLLKEHFYSFADSSSFVLARNSISMHNAKIQAITVGTDSVNLIE